MYAAWVSSAGWIMGVFLWQTFQDKNLGSTIAGHEAEECVSDWISRFRGFFLRFGDCLGLLWLFWGLRKTWGNYDCSKDPLALRINTNLALPVELLCKAAQCRTRPRRGELALLEGDIGFVALRLCSLGSGM